MNCEAGVLMRKPLLDLTGGGMRVVCVQFALDLLDGFDRDCQRLAQAGALWPCD